MSCGVLLINKGSILACVPTTTFGLPSGFDIPKGCIEEDEFPSECALRELKEETGIKLRGCDMETLGEFRYRRDKDLTLFVSTVPVDITKCDCTSYFELNGKQVPEVVGYTWVPFSEVSKFYKSLQPVLTAIIDVITGVVNDTAILDSLRITDGMQFSNEEIKNLRMVLKDAL